MCMISCLGFHLMPCGFSFAELQGCSLAAAMLLVRYLNNYERQRSRCFTDIQGIISGLPFYTVAIFIDSFKAERLLLQCWLSNISTIMTDRDLICVTHVQNIMFGLLPYAMAFLLQNFKAALLLLQCCLSNISTTMKDRDINDYITLGHHV